MRADGLSIFRLFHPNENVMPWVVAERTSGMTLRFFPTWSSALDWSLITIEAETTPEVCS